MATDKPRSIVTSTYRYKRPPQKPKAAFGDAPDMTLEELQRCGAAADALWRDLVRRAIGKDRP